MNGHETDKLVDALRQIISASPNASRAAASAMGDVGERAIKLELSRSSHARGTKTPSVPFANPPSLISGRLRESVVKTRAYSSGMQQVVNIAPTTVYARIQELGGLAGKGHKSKLPPRPYVRPAMRKWAEKYRDTAAKVFWQRTGLM